MSVPATTPAEADEITAKTVPVLAFDAVTRSYPGTPPVHALRGVDVTIRQGDYVAIIGPSGSGKSTLLNLAGLLDRPSSGTLRLDGIDAHRLGDVQRTALRAHRIGIVFQAYHLLPHRTARENVALGMLYRGTASRTRMRSATQALRAVGLGQRMSALPVTLSGGEQQRVAIARALVNEPSLLLCDEPTGNLDSTMTDEIMAVLEQLHADGYTIVLITHDAAVAERAERVLTIDDGQVTADTGGQR